MQSKYWLAVLFLFPVLALGQNRTANSVQVHGASAEVLNLDTNTNTGVIRILNLSNKEITAVSVAYAGVYADGMTHRGERLVDFLPAVITMQLNAKPSPPNEGALHPAQTCEEPVAFTKIPGNPLVRVDVNVATVAYADRTAEVADEEAFARLMDERKGHLLAKQEAIQIINKALSEPATHPIANVISDLEDLRSTAKTRHTGELGFELVIDNLQEISQRSLEQNSTGAQNLRDYAAMMQKEASLLAPHINLRRQP